MTIEQVANSSEVSKAIFKALADKQRARRKTDLTNLFKTVRKEHAEISEKDFLLIFKQLQEAKVGSLVIGRKNNHNRFVWSYNLKDVANRGLNKTSTEKPTQLPAPEKKKRGRKPGMKMKTNSDKARIITINLDMSSVSDAKALIELIESLKVK